MKHLEEYLNIFLPSHPSFIFALHLAWWGFSDIKSYMLILLTFCSSCWVGRPAVSVAKKEIYLHNVQRHPHLRHRMNLASSSTIYHYMLLFFRNRLVWGNIEPKKPWLTWKFILVFAPTGGGRLSTLNISKVV